MKPTKSNINKDTCIPVSSNCVEWQGGDLPVINLCKGDSISDVVRNAAQVLQDIKEELDLSDIELACLFEACQACPEPDKTLKTILELLITKVCTLQELIGSGSSETPSDPNIILANCFRFEDSDGDTVTQLPHSEYTKRIGLQVCTILTTLNNVSNTLQNHELRITNLENADTDDDDLTVNVSCVGPGGIATILPVDDAFELLETQFCQVKNILGSVAELTQVLPNETTPSGTPPAIYKLTNPAQTLWNTAASTIAGTLQHMWLAINDLRGAVKTMQDNCCQITCEDVVVDFDIRLSDDRQVVSLFFITKSHIPNGFSDCDTLGNLLTVTDTDGNQHTERIKVAEEIGNASGYTIDLSGTPLNPDLDYTFSMDVCMTNGAMTCMKCVTKSVTYKDTCSYCEFSIVGNGSLNAHAIIFYEE